jgi:hypothetical protein
MWIDAWSVVLALFFRKMKCIYVSMNCCLCTFNYMYGIWYTSPQLFVYAHLIGHFPWCSNIFAEDLHYMYGHAYIEMLLWLLSRFMATCCGLVFNIFSPLLLFISSPNYWTIHLRLTNRRMSEIIARVFQEKTVLRTKSDDVGWEYESLVDAFNKNKMKCMPVTNAWVSC